MNRLLQLFTLVFLFTFVSMNSSAQLNRLKNVGNKLSGKESSEGTGQANLKDAGIPNDVHRNHLDQIVWSKEKISFDSPDESKFCKSFAFQDYIYGRFYLSKSLQVSVYELTKTVEDKLNYSFDVYIDGKLNAWPIELGFRELLDDKLQRTSQQVWIYILETETSSCDKVGWSRIINSLAPGEHDIKVDLRASNRESVKYDKIFATGSFKFVKKAGDVMKLGKTFADYKAGMKDATLEAKCLKCIQKNAIDQKWEESFKKVKIASQDWRIFYHEISGAILFRSIHVYCYSTWPNGACKVQTFAFRQQYNGSGFNDNVILDGVVRETFQEDIDCD
jgi:hypothetical protein